ncbi:MAG: hypothetical protein AAFP69_23715, partial [Planctomycetota bacterium]
MALSDFQKQLREMLDAVTPEDASITVAAAALESTVGLDDRVIESVNDSLEKLDQFEPITELQQYQLEAIIMPQERPVTSIINDDYGLLPQQWSRLENDAIRDRTTALIPSIGRIEIPGHPNLPYAGTGFLVADDLLMTNRHVAALFTDGIGNQELHFHPG